MRVTFWGVRGSIPTPAASTVRWGGNTACLEVRRDGHPPLVFDCGTGARLLGFKLVSESARKLDLLFSHLHMDHVFGFPFFVPIYTPGYDVRVTVPAYSREEAREKLARYLNGVYHPTRLRDLPARVTFEAIRPGRPFERSGYTVRSVALNHPGGALGYRLEIDGYSLCYVTDTAPFARPGEGLAAGDAPTAGERRLLPFLQGANVVIYDTMYDLDEYLTKMTWGHSYPEYAAALCREAGVGQLVLFHHRPDADDDALDLREAHWAAVGGGGGLRVTMAREGDTLDVAHAVAQTRRKAVSAEG